ncbi:MAG: sigma-54-dependent Fis family transcriptional regulator [Ignavibacteriae bacterium]|nr:sigma-54-dependent Fis family transcriptional regulator [Ignavibacteriota bacterium]MCB9243104.1 sigma-54-dependent Fis family transcriptional regulator [Ignavibacteriales bacterium]
MSKISGKPDRILIVDDEQSIIDTLKLILSHENYIVDGCLDGASALKKVQDEKFDLILLDIKMPRMDGMEVLDRLMEMSRDFVVIMISGHGNIETAVEATKKGAYNFLQKPLPDLHELKIIIKNAIDFKKSRDQLSELRKELIESNKIVGNSPEIESVLELINKFANLNSNVLITGESGTGKKLVAKQIHLLSSRAKEPFISISCASLNESNIDGELFGKTEDGGQVVSPGKLEEVNGGTVFFDEITHLSLDSQAKILKVIEENKFSRPGFEKEVELDVRFIFSSNKDLITEIEEGRFREDLFHRIHVLIIDVPPLRERTGDIEQLIDYFTERICSANNIPVKKFTTQAVALLKTFRWPGNVRELRNLIERLIFTVNKDSIDADDIEMPGSKHSKVLTDLINRNMSLNDFQNESEKLFLMKMLNDYDYNVTQTAEALQIQRSHLYKLMNKYDIPLPSKVK